MDPTLPWCSSPHNLAKHSLTYWYVKESSHNVLGNGGQNLVVLHRMDISGFRKLCTPSYIYLVISMIALIVMVYQNIDNVNTYCIGSYSCKVYSTSMIFVIKAIYILFWTWILNLICKSGSPGIAWFLLFLPLIMMFVFISLFFVSSL